MQRQYRSATITHFARVSYQITPEIPSKTYMMESFLKISAGLPGSLSYVEIFVENKLAPVSVERTPQETLSQEF